MARIRDFDIPASSHAEMSCHRSSAGQNQQHLGHQRSNDFLKFDTIRLRTTLAASS